VAADPQYSYAVRTIWGDFWDHDPPPPPEGWRYTWEIDGEWNETYEVFEWLEYTDQDVPGNWDYDEDSHVFRVIFQYLYGTWHDSSFEIWMGNAEDCE